MRYIWFPTGSDSLQRIYFAYVLVAGAFVSRHNFMFMETTIPLHFQTSKIYLKFSNSAIGFTAKLNIALFASMFKRFNYSHSASQNHFLSSHDGQISAYSTDRLQRGSLGTAILDGGTSFAVGGLLLEGRSCHCLHRCPRYSALEDRGVLSGEGANEQCGSFLR